MSPIGTGAAVPIFSHTAKPPTAAIRWRYLNEADAQRQPSAAAEPERRRSEAVVSQLQSVVRRNLWAKSFSSIHVLLPGSSYRYLSGPTFKVRHHRLQIDATEKPRAVPI